MFYYFTTKNMKVRVLHSIDFRNPCWQAVNQDNVSY